MGGLLAEPDAASGHQPLPRPVGRVFALEPVVSASAPTSLERNVALPPRWRLRATPDMRALADEELRDRRPPGVGIDRTRPPAAAARPARQGNIFLEVRAGTGGDEAAIFAGDLFRMYSLALRRAQGWKVES